MTNRCLFNTPGFPRAPLTNGINRYVCQLKRVTIKFCKSYGASRGVRDFIETNLIDFSNENPGVVVYVKPRRHRTPHLRAEYLSGETEIINCHNLTRDEVYRWINLLVTKSGMPAVRYRKLWHTDNPSIQGVWSPFTHRDPSLNLATFPSESFSYPPNMEPTATQRILEMAARIQEETRKKNEADKEKKKEISVAL